MPSSPTKHRTQQASQTKTILPEAPSTRMSTQSSCKSIRFKYTPELFMIDPRLVPIDQSSRVLPVSTNEPTTLRMRIWPNATQCKHAINIPIFERNKHLQNPASYRRIPLTSNLCKTMKIMVNNRLRLYFEKSNLIINYQSGFRHTRFTLDSIVIVVTANSQAIINTSYIAGIFIDFA